ncbi:TonB-dependent receptor [Terricaulis sp.]|uniref:TonB-dependent receptor n=1 Tax=Terricaulis sp. TaxID=2768686 RepID=UPI003782F564
MSNKSKLGWILLSGASLAAMGSATPAFAQEDVSEEIVVTATGRSAAIQDVPLAVTAVGGEQLQNSGAQDLRDVTQVAPSLEMGTGQSNSSGTIARIRGIGTGSDNPGFEGAVGIFIDGVYRARAGAALADLPDLQRVEVLRGPQGTLFGRNTSAGAISVVTAGPDFDPGVYIEGLLGFDDLEEEGLRGGVNVPLGDNFAVRFDGAVRAREGYITDQVSGEDINNRNRGSARLQALWDINDDASLRIIYDHSETDEVCCGVTPLAYGSTQGAINAVVTGGVVTSPTATTIATRPIDLEGRGMTVSPGRGYGEQTDEDGISAQLDWDLGGINLTSITAYRDWSATRDQDVDFNFIDIAYRDGAEVGFKNLTQEIRFQGEHGRLNWLVGLFYGNEEMNYTDTIRVGSMATFFTNAATIGGTDAFVPGPGTGCELYDYTAGPTFPSIFQCAAGLLGNVPVANAVNATNGGYVLPTTSGQGQQRDAWNVDTESLSLFTHNEFNITDSLVLTIGARYNQETKDLSADLLATNTTCTSLQQMEANTRNVVGSTLPANVGIVTFIQTVDPDGPGPATAGALSPLMNLACNPAVNPIANGAWSGTSDENEWSGTASLAWHLNEDTMIYGGYSRGYKAGGYNVDRSGFLGITPAQTNPAALNVGQLHFDPEFTDAYELGLKTTLFGNTTFNVTGYYQQIHDYQLNAFNGFNYITRNVPEVISQGVEFELAANLTENLRVTGGVVYNDSYYDSTVVFNTLDPVPNTVNSGDTLSFAPEWVATGSITWEVPLGGNLGALFYLDGRYNTEQRTQTLDRNPSGITDNDAFAIFNGRVAIGPQDRRWSVEFWGRNLTDEFYYVGAFSPPLQNSTVIYPNEPATYGVTLRARY